MRILLGLVDVANQMRIQAKEIAIKGHHVRFYDAKPYYMNYGGADDLRLKEIPNLTDYDLFEVFFGSFGPENGKAGAAKIKYLHHFCGSESRLKSVAEAQNPYARVKYSEDMVKGILERMAKLTNACTIRDMELYDHVKPYFEKVFVVPRMIDLTKYKYGVPKNNRPLVVHAPTNGWIKGTQAVVEAVTNLQKSLDFEFKLLAGLPHDKVVEFMKRADLYIDQLHVGTYGVAAMEAMAMGVPVICYISEYMEKHLTDHTFINANPDNIEEVLKATLKDGLEDGKRAFSRLFVEKYHDSKKVIEKLLEVYDAV